jgi:hypothetical protein
MPLDLADIFATGTITTLSQQLPLLETAIRESLQQVVTVLHVPSWSEYLTAVTAAAHDSYAAIGSSWTLLHLTSRPVILLLYHISRVLAVAFYRHVLITGIYHHGFSQVQQGVGIIYKFQCSLTAVEWAGEVLIVLVAIGIYRLRLYLQRQTYVKRALTFYRRQQAQVQKVSYFVDC